MNANANKITRIGIANALYSQLHDTPNMRVATICEGVSQKALLNAVGSIVDYLDYNPDASYNDDDWYDFRAEHADREAAVYYGAMDKWFAENPNASEFVDQFVSEFGTYDLPDYGSGIIYHLICGGMYMEASCAWDHAWAALEDRFTEASDD